MAFDIRWKQYDWLDEGYRTLYIEDDGSLDPIEKRVLARYDPHIADLFGLFLTQYRQWRGYGIDSEEKMLAHERQHIAFAEDFCNRAFSFRWDRDHIFAGNNLYVLFHYIWFNSEYLGDFDIPDEVYSFFYHRMGYSRTRKEPVDPEELLFWSFRFCAWWGFDNRLQYTLYKAFAEGRFERFYTGYPNRLIRHFLCDDNLWEDDPEEDEPDEG